MISAKCKNTFFCVCVCCVCPEIELISTIFVVRPAGSHQPAAMHSMCVWQQAKIVERERRVRDPFLLNGNESPAARIGADLFRDKSNANTQPTGRLRLSEQTISVGIVSSLKSSSSKSFDLSSQRRSVTFT